MATFLVAMLLALQQRPLVTANLDRSEVRVGDPVTLRITVQATTGGVIVPMPSLPSQLQAVSTREVSHASLSLPGGRTTTVSRELILVANAPGEYAIPPIRIRVDGENAYTPRLTLSVTGAAAPSPTPGARLLARMEPDTVFVGQQATLVGELLMSVDLQMRLTRPPSYEAPSPSDFWMQELQSDARAEPRIIDEERYVGQRFYRAYFPLTAGKYAFAPAKATYEARQGFLFAPQVFELRSASPRIVVLPHPSAGRPSNFDGAVGKFDIAARVEPNQGAVGDALTLIVEITGSGN